MENKFFIGIISHSGSTRRKQQLDIWREANIPEIEYYYFIGDPSIENEYRVDEKNRIIYLKVPDNYESLPLKTKGILNFYLENFSKSTNGILKTDDDIEINPSLVYKMLVENSDKKYYGIAVDIINPYESNYHWGKCESENWNQTKVTVPVSKYCAGGGYYINKDHVGSMVKEFSLYECTIFEDVATGTIMNKLGIYPDHIDVKNNGLNW
jgi:hypothetical protein